jgi:hypothetical protein
LRFFRNLTSVSQAQVSSTSVEALEPIVRGLRTAVLGQGLRIKIGVFQHVQQVVWVECRLHAFGFGAVLDGLVLPQ